MSPSNKKTQISKSRLSDFSSRILSQRILLPAYLQKWRDDQTLDELTASLAFLSIPETDRPDDLQNPLDEICSRLPPKAFIWAHATKVRFQCMDRLGKYTKPGWFPIVKMIIDYEKRCAMGIAESLPAGTPPLRWQSYTTERPFARPLGCQEHLELAKNYRKKGSSRLSC